MRTLVTGGEGFLGAHLVARLREQGGDPIVARHAEHDLVRQADTERLFAHVRPGVVFHLAAEVGGIGANQASPGRYWYANLAMGLNVLEASRLAGVHKLVMVGTVCSYPRDTPVPFREASMWDGYPEQTNAAYGVAKRALLTGAQAYRAQYGLNTIFLVPVNLYGPGDNFDPVTSHVIPAMIRKMIEARDRGTRQVVLWGDGSPTREFLYVDDCVEALVAAVNARDGVSPVNLGTGEEISIAALARLIAAATRFAGEIRWDTQRPNGQPRRRLDVSRANELFGFSARVPLPDGIARTVDWFERTRRSLGGVAHSGG
jgi:GDP-L-fucose synthase